MVELSCRPMSDWTDNPEAGILVMNPPYGARLKPDDMTELYRGIGSSLKKYFPGYHAWIIGMNDDDFANIGLKPSMKIPLLNGNLECSLREYVLFDGSYSDFRADGGKVSRYGEEDEEERRPRKMKHLSDDEWKAETRKFGHGKDRPSKGPKSGKGGKGGFGSDRRFDKKNKPSRGEKKYDMSERPERREYNDRSERRGYGEAHNADRQERRNYGEKRDDRQERRNYGGKRDDRQERRNYGGNRRQSGYKSREAVSVNPQGPKISPENAHIFSNVPMRSRKRKFNSEEED